MGLPEVWKLPLEKNPVSYEEVVGWPVVMKLSRWIANAPFYPRRRRILYSPPSGLQYTGAPLRKAVSGGFPSNRFGNFTRRACVFTTVGNSSNQESTRGASLC